MKCLRVVISIAHPETTHIHKTKQIRNRERWRRGKNGKLVRTKSQDQKHFTFTADNVAIMIVMGFHNCHKIGNNEKKRTTKPRT